MKNRVKSIQAAAYNGVRTVFDIHFIRKVDINELNFSPVDLHWIFEISSLNTHRYVINQFSCNKLTASPPL